MLLVGFMFKNVPHIQLADDIHRGWASALRNIALAVILIKAGLGIDATALRRLSLVCARSDPGTLYTGGDHRGCGFTPVAWVQLGLGIHARVSISNRNYGRLWVQLGLGIHARVSISNRNYGRDGFSWDWAFMLE